MKSKSKVGQTLIGLAFTAIIGTWAVNTFMRSFNAAAASVKSYETCDLSVLAKTKTEAQDQSPLTASMISNEVAAGKTVTIKKAEGSNCFRIYIR